MRIVFILLFILTLLAWIFVSSVAESAMHETTAAVVGLACLVCLATASILEHLKGIQKEVQGHGAGTLSGNEAAEIVAELRSLNLHLASLCAEMSAAVERGEENAEKGFVFLQNMDGKIEHLGALLKWIGERGQLTSPEGDEA